MRFLLCILFIVICTQVPSQKAVSKERTLTTIDTLSIAVLPFNQLGTWVFGDSCRPSELSLEEMIKVDSLLMAAVKDHNKDRTPDDGYAIDFDQYKYKRQYIAVINSKGQKEVWVNGICEGHCKFTGEEWKKHVIMVDDGGNCFFNMKINLSTQKYYGVYVNGYA